MAILQGIHRQNKGREVDQNTNPRGSNKATAGLHAVGAEAVERNDQAGHVKRVADEDTLAIQQDDSQTATKIRKEGIITHPNLKIGYQLVRDKGRLVWKHVVCGSRISDGEATAPRRRRNRGSRHSLDDGGKMFGEDNAHGRRGHGERAYRERGQWRRQSLNNNMIA
jgi:hypothetical protein